jgi:hypothetical protein
LVSLGGAHTALSANPAVVPELTLANAFTNSNSITVNSANPDLSISNIGNGISVTITGGGAQGSDRSRRGEGFVGSNSTFPIVGFGSTYGVFGETMIDANYQPSIYGYASGTTQLDSQPPR